MTFAASFQGIAAPEHVDALRTSLAILERASRKQSGTIRYDFYQSADDPTIFMLFAIWESKADWQAHVASAAHRRHVESLPEGAWVTRPVKTEWQPLSDQ